MPKRLGYKTDACMMLIRRKVNEWMIECRINKSELVNRLLLKYYEHKLCHTCLGGVIHTQNCPRCDAVRIFCDDEKCMQVTKSCSCNWSDEDINQSRLDDL